MSQDHNHHDQAQSPETRDTSSQALSEALHSSFAIVKFAMVALVVLFILKGFFTVGPQEKAIILRFGKPQGEGQKMLLGAGWHWSLPYPIDDVVRIPVTEIQKVTSTIGWYPTTPEMELSGTEPPPGQSLDPRRDGYAISADRNIFHSRVTISYHIDDPLAAIFNFAYGTNQEFGLAGVSNAVQNAVNNALISTAARFNVDDVLTRNRAGFKDAVNQRLNELIDQEHLGVSVDACDVDSIPPRQLKDVFAAVAIATQNREKMRIDATVEQNRILTEADARAASITNAAESARVRYVELMKADAAAFTKLLPQYENNPGLFQRMELAKAMSQILTNVQDKIFLSRRDDGKTRELRLMLNREPKDEKSGANQ